MVKDRLDGILAEAKGNEGWKGQSMVSLEDMRILIEYGGKVVELNKEVGDCYSHVVEREGKEFFAVTANDVRYDSRENVFDVRSRLDLL